MYEDIPKQRNVFWHIKLLDHTYKLNFSLLRLCIIKIMQEVPIETRNYKSSIINDLFVHMG